MSAGAPGLLDRIRSRKAAVGVIGLGYVGLPLALLFEEAGFPVIGFDSDPAKPEALARGESYIKHLGRERVAKAFAGGRARATSDFARLSECDAVLICVPTPLGPHREPDLSFVRSAASEIARRLRPGQLVVLESTTYPGTTREELLPLLTARGLACGSDFFLAFSPEREDPGNERFSTRNIPKIVGGIDAASLEAAVALYGSVIDTVVPVSSPEVAESSKLLENIFRSVNIALVNEMKVILDRMGIDVWEVIAAAKTKPFGFMPFTPGPGLGGHCLAGGETVRIRDGAINTVLPLSELFERCRAKGKAITAGDAELLLPDGLETLSIDPRTGGASWRRVSGLFRRRFAGPMAEVRLAGNRVLRTTDRHPMLIVEGDQLVVREARDLKPGDRVPLFAGMSDGGPDSSAHGDPALDLLKLLPAAVADKLHVRIVDIPWSRFAPLLKSRYGWTIRDSIRKDSLSARRYLALESELNVGREQLLLLSGRGSAHTQIPAILKLSPDFCRFLGYFLSEGCITEERMNPRVRLTFNRNENEYMDDVVSILRALGVRVSIHNDKTFQATTLRVGSIVLGHVLRDVLCTGTDCYSMRIPGAVMGASNRHHEEVLAGLLRGDGDVDVRTGPRPYVKKGRSYLNQFNSGKVGYFSSSPELFAQAESLLQGLGFSPMRKKGKPHLRMAGSESLQRLARLLGGEKGRRLDRLQESRVREGRPRRNLPWSGGRAAPVKSVRLEPGQEPVFSVEVPGSHTFLTTGGVFVHNCIPLDPFYLAWKAAEHGVWARFVELAGEINSGMPRYVVDKTAEALNSHGKSVKGARVLVLGLSYKADIDDDRESPSFEIIELLAERGAIVAYCDPYIPVARKGRQHDLRLVSVPCTAEEFARHDAIVVSTAHKAFRDKALYKGARLVVDTRNLVLPLGVSATVVRA